MTLTVEDGTGLSNSESYISVTDADTYHTNRGNTAWTGTESEKEIALRKATEYLDQTYNWSGTLYITTQALSWPRSNVYDAQGRDISQSVPSLIANATAEAALQSLSNTLDPVLSKSDYVKREKVGDLEVEYKDGSPRKNVYTKIDKMLSGLYSSKSGGSTIGLNRA